MFLQHSLRFHLHCFSKYAFPYFLISKLGEVCMLFVGVGIVFSTTAVLCYSLLICHYITVDVWFSADMEKVSSNWYWIGITGRMPLRLFQNYLSRKGENKFLQRLIWCYINCRLYVLVISVLFSFKKCYLVWSSICCGFY